MNSLALGFFTLIVLFTERRLLGASNASTTSRANSVRSWLLTLCGFAGIGLWWGSAPEPNRIHYWDMFHYYVGAKYFDELGYSRLYDCAAAVDLASGSPVLDESAHIRDLASNELKTVGSLTAAETRCRERFLPDKWKAFEADVLWFKAKIGERWRELFFDHGFNASPVWIVAARALIPHATVDDASIRYIAMLDQLLLGAMWIVIFFSFPQRAFAAGAVFWGINGLGTFDWTGGAFLRHDWLVATIFGIAAISTRRFAVAGTFVAYATVTRVFPVVTAGIVLFECARSDGGFRHCLRYIVGFSAALGAFVLVSGSIVGMQSWVEFSANLSKHVDTRAGNLVGLPHAVDHVVQCRIAGFGNDGVCEPPERSSNSMGLLSKLAGIVSVALLLLWLWFKKSTLESWEICVLLVGSIPLLTSPAAYYYELFLVFGLLATRFRAMGIAVVSLAILLLLTRFGVHPPNKIYLIASILVVQFVFMLPLFVRSERANPSLSLPT